MSQLASAANQNWLIILVDRHADVVFAGAFEDSASLKNDGIDLQFIAGTSLPERSEVMRQDLVVHVVRHIGTSLI